MDTLSGARIRSISAHAFGFVLAQFGEVGAAARTAHVVWGAFVEDDLIGVAYLERVLVSSTGAGVAVAPARRHLGIAKDLLHALVHDAGVRGLATLVYTNVANDPTPQRLAAALGLTVARRVRGTEAFTSVAVPPPRFVVAGEEHTVQRADKRTPTRCVGDGLGKDLPDPMKSSGVTTENFVRVQRKSASARD